MRSRRILTLILTMGEDVLEEDMDVEPGLRQANPTEEVEEDVHI